MKGSTGSFRVRDATEDDGDVIFAALLHAFNWNPSRPAFSRQEVVANPGLARYAAGWPKPRDLGVIAVDEGGTPIGACWLRFFTDEDHGYGFVAADVPEVGIGIDAKWRGKGIGRVLIRAIAARAKAAGIAKISLSVEKDNFAANLYRSEGFVDLLSGEDDFVMVKVL
jgi:ribosomal protein S18 acetylase RimI-like enzyme